MHSFIYSILFNIVMELCVILTFVNMTFLIVTNTVNKTIWLKFSINLLLAWTAVISIEEVSVFLSKTFTQNILILFEKYFFHCLIWK